MPATDRDGGAAQGARLWLAAIGTGGAQPMSIEFREITAATVSAMFRLDAGDAGRQVAPNAVSIAQAHFEPAAWFRAVYAAGEPVGFVMLYDPSLATAPERERPLRSDRSAARSAEEASTSQRFYLWRLMIDQAQQGRGYGHATVERLVEHVRTRPGATELYTSHVPEAEALARFYGSLGFRYTGEEDDGELVMARPL